METAGSQVTERILEEIAKVIADQLSARPFIKPHQELWDAGQIATYLRTNRRAILERYAPLRDFPAAIRIPLADGKLARPRWKAIEVIAWTERHQERKKAGRSPGIRL